MSQVVQTIKVPIHEGVQIVEDAYTDVKIGDEVHFYAGDFIKEAEDLIGSIEDIDFSTGDLFIQNTEFGAFQVPSYETWIRIN